MINERANKINEIVSRINTHPEYSSCVKREVFHAQREEAQKHSLDLELEGEGKKLTKNERVMILGRLDEAWKFLCERGMDIFSLAKLGAIIEPEPNKTGSFRNSQTKFGDFWPTLPTDIHYEIEQLVYQTNNSDLSPVERASNIHLGLVKIHPFIDGNGRAARLAQNFCLHQRGYPLVIIPSNERGKYLEIIGNALRDRYNFDSGVLRQSDAERRFHEYIESKVFESSLDLEKELKQRRMYQIELKGIDGPQTGHILAKVIRNIGRNRPDSRGGITVSVSKNGGKRAMTLDVVGDVSTEEITSTLDAQGRFRFSYDINNKYC